MSDTNEVHVFPRLQNKVVLISGSTAGIGEATAKNFAASGSKLILFARREDRLEKQKQKLSKYNVAIHTAKVDVSSAEEVKKAVQDLPEEFKNIDILVNNAGLALGLEPTHSTTEEQVNTVFDTNVKGVFWLVQAIVPLMIARGSGHIINVASIAGYEAYKNGSIYCASKFAVRALTTSLRKELIHTAIRVSEVSPGLVQTEFSLVRLKDQTKAETVYKGLPLGPLLAEDIAEDILYIASRPPHVQVVDIITFPTNQGSTEFVYRE